MKKKYSLIGLSFLLILAFTAGCGSSGAASGGNTNNANNVDAVLEKMADEAEGNSETTTEAESETEATTQAAAGFDTGGEEMPDITSTEGVDIDLTQLSGTMLYSQVNYMMYKPEEYLGKTVKLPGTFSAVYSEEAKRYYFGCLVSDQAACCTLGVEFELPDSYVYPDDYPEEGEEITVFGTFDTYQEGEYTYAVLRNAELIE